MKQAKVLHEVHNKVTKMKDQKWLRHMIKQFPSNLSQDANLTTVNAVLCAHFSDALCANQSAGSLNTNRHMTHCRWVCSVVSISITE
jgi:hypothetical protein